ncbi:hypothetical protein [Massilia sp. CF038]|uniref:hypothetical protein n=1 Tax=Massilia sp. CF038 TaxID=1881045 RepID=UPI0009133227|nr:hypothetical protein [Massilia sp. CF038]SHG95101.1 hypothetical protein SAMN05428948_2031 [Massilia sp. CF038]
MTPPLHRSKQLPALYATMAVILAMVLYGPIAQPEHYHAFADQRSWFGIDHLGDVLSNLFFLLVAAWGALRLKRSPLAGNARMGALVFIAALALTAFGSTWYHLAPDNARLLWDRLPIALACAALLATVLSSSLALLLLIPAAVASVFWWQATGDLRPYLLLQMAPLVLIPLLQWQAGAALTQRRAFGLAIGLYVLAKLCEVADHAGMALLTVVSGHTLKHILAAAAAAVIVRAITAGPQQTLDVS